MLVLAPWIIISWDSFVTSYGAHSLIVRPGVHFTFAHGIELDVSFPFHAFVADPVFVALQDVATVIESTARPWRLAVRRLRTDADLDIAVDFSDTVAIGAHATAASEVSKAV
jgi:hypothetical protein